MLVMQSRNVLERKAVWTNHRDSERSAFIILLGDINSFCRFSFPEGIIRESIDHFSSRCWCFDDQLVYPRRVFPRIHLGDTPYTDQPIRVASQHKFLKRAHLFQVALLRCPKDTMSQVTNSSIGRFPVSGVPVSLFLGSVCRERFSHLTFPLISSMTLVLWVMYQDHVSRLSARVSPSLALSAQLSFPVAFRRAAFAF